VVNDVISGMFHKNYKEALKTGSDSMFESYLSILQNYELVDGKEALIAYRISFYSEKANCEKLIAAVKDYIKVTGKDDDISLNEPSWTIYEKCNDPLLVHQATEIMERVVKANPLYAEMDTYAALLFKDKQYSKAEEAAMKAIGIGKNANSDVASTEELLEKIKAAKER